MKKMSIEKEIKKILIEESDGKYKTFLSSIIPEEENILGVRSIQLKKTAKLIYKNFDYETYLKLNNLKYHEEIVLQGLIIGLLKKTPEEKILYIKEFIPRITNWAICDSFCSGLKFTKEYRALMWEFLKPYFNSEKEFYLRFAYVMLLSYFIVPEYIDKIFVKIDGFKSTKYYSQMSVAWLLSMCFVKDKEKTYMYLKNSKLDKYTYNKSIQKICESLSVDKMSKEKCKSLKK